MIDELAQVLDAEGGWLRIDILADRLGGKRETVRRLLYRLEGRGGCVRRVVDGSTWRGGVEIVQPVTEWRIR